jgi:isoleucyl-tRNA synthetase
MRAGLPVREPEFLKRWNAIDLYGKQRAAAKGLPRFVLHDGPPYANGAIHIGHALNKILKDLVVRSQGMLGLDSNYVPGWDCHGLPIEWKIEEQYRAKGLNKDEVPVVEFRKECRAFAAHWVDEQRKEFRRLGVGGDWDHPYLTMTYPAEAQIARELMKFASSGQLYRGSKPVMWSVVEKTALAEAEIEYEEFTSDTVFVAFPVRKANPTITVAMVEGETNAQENARIDIEKTRIQNLLKSASIVIWTTTPWTLPGNRAIAYSDRIVYGLYVVTANDRDFGPKIGERYILAKSLAENVSQAAKIALELQQDIPSGWLDDLTCAHPLAGFIPPLDGEG